MLRSRRRWRRSASGCSGCWCATAWSRPTTRRGRLRLGGDGRVVRELKRAWHDGTRELVCEPLELLERLAAMTPRPETNLLICHGLLASRSRWRARMVAYGRVAAEPTALAPAL